jgi:hypothetical protein
MESTQNSQHNTNMHSTIQYPYYPFLSCYMPTLYFYDPVFFRIYSFQPIPSSMKSSSLTSVVGQEDKNIFKQQRENTKTESSAKVKDKDTSEHKVKRKSKHKNKLTQVKNMTKKQIPPAPIQCIQTAKILGYYGKTDDWKIPSKRIALLSKQHKNSFIRNGWLLYPNITYNEWYTNYMIFKKKKCCLKCNKNFDIFFTKVYCNKCVFEILRDDHCEVEKIAMDWHSLNYMRQYFMFLLNIPITNKFVCICSVCKEKSFCVWFSGFREICIGCTIMIHNTKYPNGKYLDCNEDNLKTIINSYPKL